MPIPDPITSMSIQDAKGRIAAAVFEDGLGGPELGKIGLEPEFLVLRVGEDGVPMGRLKLEGERSVLSSLEALVASGQLAVKSPGPPPIYELENGGRITFEPGAQVEHSTATHGAAAEAMQDVDETAQVLAEALKPAQAVLAPVGLDVWTDREAVEQQLRAARYNSMAAYFDLRSTHGRVMMRHTGSFQVNLDLGEREVATQRWRLANLLSPLATASFACSPEGGAVSRRAQAWQALDPTRTGFPLALLRDSRADPGQAYADFALDADVLLFGSGTDATCVGEPGFSMRQWIEEGHSEHGSPTEADLDYHLTTLFPEVRLRGFLELRSCDSLPARWRAVNVIFWAGLLYDQAAREAALALLEPTLEALPVAWIDSAVAGLRSEYVRDLALPIWQLAMQGARRLPKAWFRAQDLATTEEFIERFVAPLRSPAVELAEALSVSPKAALEWARA